MGDVIEGTMINANLASVGGGLYAADAAAAFFSDSSLVDNVALVRTTCVCVLATRFVAPICVWKSRKACFQSLFVDQQPLKSPSFSPPRPGHLQPVTMFTGIEGWNSNSLTACPLGQFQQGNSGTRDYHNPSLIDWTSTKPKGVCRQWAK